MAIVIGAGAGMLAAGERVPAAGFLAFNWAPARIFMGDTGSLALGYTFTSLPPLAPLNSRPKAVFWMVMSLGCSSPTPPARRDAAVNAR